MTATGTGQTVRHLSGISAEPGAVGVLARARALEAHIGRGTPAREIVALRRATADADPLLAISAIHALAGAPGAAATAALLELADADEAWRREHAVWALGRRSGSASVTKRLLDVAAEGGFAWMLAQLSLEQQAASCGGGLRLPVRDALIRQADPAARARLVETLGLDLRVDVREALDEIALDPDEHPAVRAAAAAGLAGRGPGAQDSLERLATDDDQVAQAALLALLDHAPAPTPPPGNGRLAIAQLFLHADLDANLTNAGAGDNGGIASLLVLLGDALAEAPGVDRVLTLCRGQATDAIADALLGRREPAAFAAVAMPTTAMRDAWEHRVAVERGIRRQLRRHGPFDVMHLRMADVGAFAGERAARSLGIGVAFTAAPDPHAVLDQLGALDREELVALGARDADEHWWFRARLVERLANTADAVAVMPRRNVMRELPRLLDLDPAAFAQRTQIVAEGVHGGTLRRAEADAFNAVGGRPPAVLADLGLRIAAMPPERWALPLLVSVGRLAAIKGVDRVVAAWAGDPELVASMNLVVVGGDLERPSPEEHATLDAIEQALAASPEARPGLVMLGHRPHLDAARVLAFAALGDGVYVCGSAKEEYGLAIVEALGAGLTVVAPRVGGPATYLDPRHGVLVDTTRVEAIRVGIHVARELAREPGRATEARAKVRETMSIEQMAEQLVALYRGVAREASVASSR